MSTTVSFNNLSFVVPEIGEEYWGGPTKVDGLLVSLANNALSKYGGAFNIVTEVDFGTAEGIKALSYKSSGINISTTGVVRFANAESIGWRNFANNADILLTVNASNALVFNSIAIPTPSSTVTFSNKKFQDSTCSFIDEVDATKEFKVQCSGITTATTRTWTVPDSSDTFAGISSVQTLTNKVITGNTALNLIGGSSSVITLPSVTGTLATLNGVETLSNKTFVDTNFVIGDDADPTKKLKWELSPISTATTRTWTVPDVSDTLVGLVSTQTITGKTLTGNVAVNLMSGSAVITLPVVTGTLSTLAGSETLTNKTLTGNIAVNLMSGSATVTLPVVTGTLATLAGTETLTNKTLTGNIALNLVGGSSSVITLPSASGTLATLAGTEVLTNKTLTGNIALTLVGGSSAVITLPSASGTIATLAGTEVLTNKDIDGGTAANNRRITLPKDTIANLNALTRKEGTLCYASDTNALYADNGATLDLISSAASTVIAFKNRIINGDMRIDQRNEGASLTNGTSGLYSVDRFVINGLVGSKFKATRTPSVIETGFAVRVAAGFANYIELESLSSYALGANDYYLMQQPIEANNFCDMAFGTASAQTVTISFLVNSTLTGNFGGSLINHLGDRSYTFSYTVNSANTWETKTITIPGDTAGTWTITSTNGTGAAVRFSMGASGTYTGTVNTWGTTNAMGPSSGITHHVNTSGSKLRITGVQLEKGSSATGFEFRSFESSFSACERYYQKTYDQGVAVATATYLGADLNLAINGEGFYNGGNVKFKKTMRAVPSIVIYSLINGATGVLSRLNNGIANVGNSGVDTVSSGGFRIFSSNSGMVPATALYGYHYTAGAEL